MKIVIDTDHAGLHNAANALKDNPNLLDDLANNPQQVLASLGVQVDNETAQRISQGVQQRRAANVQAAVVHIDV